MAEDEIVVACASLIFVSLCAASVMAGATKWFILYGINNIFITKFHFSISIDVKRTSHRHKNLNK